jgi:hypothetical protein
MFLYLDTDVDITRDNVRVLITLTSKDIVMLIGATTLNSNLELFGDFFYFLTFALTTSILGFHGLA